MRSVGLLALLSHVLRRAVPARPCAARTATVPPGGLLRLRSCARGAAIEVLAGTAWITQAGDLRDHVLPAGASLAPRRGGLVVAQALGAAPLRLRLRALR